MKHLDLLRPMTDEEFADALRQVGEYVRDLLLADPPRSLIPQLHSYEWAFNAAGQLTPRVVMLILAGFEVERCYKILAAVGEQLADNQHIVRAVFFVSEAWLSVQQIVAGKPPKYKQAVDDPQRQEIVSIAGSTLDGRIGMAYVKVRRTLDNRMLPGALTVLELGRKDEGGRMKYEGGEVCSAPSSLIPHNSSLPCDLAAAFMHGYRRGCLDLLKVQGVTPKRKTTTKSRIH